MERAALFAVTVPRRAAAETALLSVRRACLRALSFAVRSWAVNVMPELLVFRLCVLALAVSLATLREFGMRRVRRALGVMLRSVPFLPRKLSVLHVRRALAAL